MHTIIDGYLVELIDEGTLDTVLQVNGVHRVSFGQEYAAEFRDNVGALTEAGFESLAQEAIEDFIQEQEVSNSIKEPK